MKKFIKPSAKRQSPMKKKAGHKVSLEEMALKALKEAVSEAIKDHEKTGDPIVIYRNGKIAKVSAKDFKNKYYKNDLI